MEQPDTNRGGNEFQNETLFYNHHIKIDRKTVYYHDWHLKAISYLNDKIDEQGNFYTWEEFSNKFKIENQAFLYYSLVHAIPKNWKKRIKESSKKLTQVTNPKIQQLKQLKKPSKQFYLDFIQYIVTTHVSK